MMEQPYRGIARVVLGGLFLHLEYKCGKRLDKHVVNAAGSHRLRLDVEQPLCCRQRPAIEFMGSVDLPLPAVLCT